MRADPCFFAFVGCVDRAAHFLEDLGALASFSSARRQFGRERPAATTAPSSVEGKNAHIEFPSGIKSATIYYVSRCKSNVALGKARRIETASAKSKP